jgi:hypothetical protein
MNDVNEQIPKKNTQTHTSIELSSIWPDNTPLAHPLESSDSPSVPRADGPDIMHHTLFLSPKSASSDVEQHVPSYMANDMDFASVSKHKPHHTVSNTSPATTTLSPTKTTPSLSPVSFQSTSTTNPPSHSHLPLYQRLAVLFACTMLGLGAWLPVTAIYTELPAMSTTQPEASALSSYVTAAQQSGNVIFFIFTWLLSSWVLASPYRHRISIILILLTDIVVMAITATFYSVTAPVFAVKRSVILLSSMITVGFVCACTNVLFYPLLAPYPINYTHAYSVGLGLANALTGCLALLQRSSSGYTRFSVSTDYLIITIVSIAVFGCFCFLSWHPWSIAQQTHNRSAGPRNHLFTPIASLILDKPVSEPVQMRDQTVLLPDGVAVYLSTSDKHHSGE